MNKIKILKLVMFIIALAICIGATIYLFPVMRNLSTVEGQVAFTQKVENSGVLGLLSLFALEVAQIFLFIIPFPIVHPVSGKQIKFFILLLFKYCINDAKSTLLSFPPTINVFTSFKVSIALIVEFSILTIFFCSVNLCDKLNIAFY